MGRIYLFRKRQICLFGGRGFFIRRIPAHLHGKSVGVDYTNLIDHPESEQKKFMSKSRDPG